MDPILDSLLASARMSLARAMRFTHGVRGSFRLQRLLVPSSLTARHPRTVTSGYPVAPALGGTNRPQWQGSTSRFIGWNVWFRGSYELDTLGVLAALLRPGMNVIEAGANEGYHTVFAAWCVSRSGTVWPFEPNATPRACLEDNVRRLGWSDRIHVRARALAETPGEATFYVPVEGAENQGVGGLVDNSTVETRPIVVPVTTLDHELPHERCALLKMDVQGAKARVLRGARQLLDRNRPAVLFEVMPEEEGGAESMALLRDAGYRLWRVEATSRAPYFALRPLPAARWFGNCLAIHPRGDHGEILRAAP
jgi:FkbM family methyltransferase